jgi:hypothetical protein
MSRGMSAVPQKDRRGSRRTVGWRRDLILGAKYLLMHARRVPKGERKKAKGRRQNPELTSQAQQPQSLAQSCSGTRRACAVPPLSERRVLHGCAGNQTRLRVPPQVQLRQHVARPTSDRLPASSVVLPAQCRWQARPARRADSTGLTEWSSTLAQIRRNADFRELWRAVSASRTPTDRSGGLLGGVAGAGG